MTELLAALKLIRELADAADDLGAIMAEGRDPTPEELDALQLKGEEANSRWAENLARLRGN